MRKFSACLQEVFPPTEQAFFHPWKNTASQNGALHYINIPVQEQAEA